MHIKNKNNKKIVSFKKNNLSVMSYSQPVDKKLEFKELNNKLFSLPNLPNAIPYRTSYYKKDWGFNITHKEKKT